MSLREGIKRKTFYRLNGQIRMLETIGKSDWMALQHKLKCQTWCVSSEGDYYRFGHRTVKGTQYLRIDNIQQDEVPADILMHMLLTE